MFEIFQLVSDKISVDHGFDFRQIVSCEHVSFGWKFLLNCKSCDSNSGSIHPIDISTFVD